MSSFQRAPSARTTEAGKYGVNAPAPEVTKLTVAIDRITGHVVAIGINDERLDASLGQQHDVPAGFVPEIGKPLEGVTVTRNEITGLAV
ncbi:hypothetical protein WKW80_09320 [Variovorax humicola]|uniref:Uncharacterized protein n=1 Tax=Variovorax humicola TaxID=1769758 RepID=A0ABU8VX96_9BURK